MDRDGLDGGTATGAVADPARHDATLRLGPVHLEAHRVIYGTIVVMTALSLTDDSHPGVWPLTAAILGPLIALVAAHAFSDLADRQIAVNRPLRWTEAGRVLLDDAQYLLVAVPPVLIMAIAITAGWNEDVVVEGLLVLGTASLAFWGAFAARRAALPMRWQVLYAVGYGATGVLVILLELLLSGH